MACQDIWEIARAISNTDFRRRRHQWQKLFNNCKEGCFPELTSSQADLVLTMRNQGHMSVKQLAQALHVKAPSVSMRVERLVEMGVLTREENPADRREVLIRLTGKTEEIIDEVERRHLQLMVRLLDQLGPEYVEKWYSVCRRIDEVLGTLAQDMKNGTSG